MSSTAFGPQGPNFSTVRPPADPQASAGTDTWFKNCSVAGSKDGTFATAAFFNTHIANMRYAVRSAGITLDDADDTMLYRAMQAIANEVVVDIPSILQSNITLYVNGAIGSDANDGSANAVGSALKTIQAAIDKAFGYVAGQFAVTIRVAGGIYAGFATPLRPGPSITIIGDEATPSNVLVTSTSGTTCQITGPNTATIRGVKGESSTGSIDNNIFASSNGATLVCANTESGNAGGAVFCASGSTTILNGAHNFKGNATWFVKSTTGGQLLILGSAALTVTGNVNVSATAVAGSNGTIQVSVPQPTWNVTGAVTGQRYSALLNGIIYVQGAGANYFPGSTAGSTGTGGQYA